MASQFSADQIKLFKGLAGRQGELNRLERYYSGDAPLPEGAEGQSKAYQKFQRKSRLNMAEMVVSAIQERMRIGGFRTGADDDENGDVEARRLWKASNLTVGSADLHTILLKFGTAYAIVGKPEGEEYPVVTVEDPRQVFAATSATNGNKVIAAVKVFTEGDFHYAYFYYPDTIEVFKKQSQSSIYKDDGWDLLADGRRVNTLGQVPVVKFTNKDSAGEYESHTDLLDRINHMILQRLVIVTTQAFRQRVLKGDFPTHDSEGNEIDYEGVFQSSAGSLWMIPEGAEVSELGQADIAGILSGVRADIQDLAGVTRTPMHYLMPEGANGSAEGAALAREGLVFKTQNRMDRATPGWAKVMSLMFLWMDDVERAKLIELEPIWYAPERYSLAERADANSKFQDMPFRSRMGILGQFSPTEVADMEIQRAGEAIFAQSLTGGNGDGA
jgi:hypothetical protein